MAQVTIRLTTDPETGKKNITIKLHSDPDALPHEHEQQHRALVDKLVEGGVVKASELGKITVEREEEAKEPAAPVSAGPQAKPQAQAQGGK